jgi:hypothetical protein
LVTNGHFPQNPTTASMTTATDEPDVMTGAREREPRTAVSTWAVAVSLRHLRRPSGQRHTTERPLRTVRLSIPNLDHWSGAVRAGPSPKRLSPSHAVRRKGRRQGQCARTTTSPSAPWAGWRSRLSSVRRRHTYSYGICCQGMTAAGLLDTQLQVVSWRLPRSSSLSRLLGSFSHSGRNDAGV